MHLAKGPPFLSITSTTSATVLEARIRDQVSMKDSVLGLFCVLGPSLASLGLWECHAPPTPLSSHGIPLYAMLQFLPFTGTLVSLD